MQKVQQNLLPREVHMGRQPLHLAIRFQCNPLYGNSQQLTFVSLLFPSLYSKGGNIHSVGV